MGCGLARWTGRSRGEIRISLTSENCSAKSLILWLVNIPFLYSPSLSLILPLSHTSASYKHPYFTHLPTSYLQHSDYVPYAACKVQVHTHPSSPHLPALIPSILSHRFPGLLNAVFINHCVYAGVPCGRPWPQRRHLHPQVGGWERAEVGAESHFSVAFK